MIKYKFSEEKKILLHYAQKLNQENITAILLKDQIDTAKEAKELASFFWVMVDQTVIDSENGTVVEGEKNLAAWCEYIMQSLRSHFVATGYLRTWEEESDKG